jgi:hypothetical protein
MKNKDTEKVEDLPAILFPHAHLPESTVKQILSFLGPITIFRPWFLERPVFGSEADGANRIQVLHPPDNLKPGEKFRTRLSEYRQWIESNRDRGYTEFLQASQEMGLTENTTWEIRQMIRRGGRQTSAPRENPALKWHLILHLVQDLEDQRMEADQALKTLKEQEVPLKGIVEESGEMDNLLEDLPPFESEPIGDEYRFRQILEAWFALFGEYLNERSILVTSSRHVMAYVTDLWKEYQIEDQGEDIGTIRFKFPDLSQYTLEDLGEIKKKRLNDDKIRELKGLILKLGENVTNNLPRLEVLSKEVEASCPWELSGGVLNIVVKYFASFPQGNQTKMERVLRGLTNKTLFLVEDGSHHG